MLDPIRVGYARVDITPDRPMRMLGYAQPPGGRYHQVVLDPIYLTCLAFSDEATTVLLCSVDLVGMTEEVADAIKQVVTRATGIPGTHQFYAATHTHSAPDYTEISSILQKAAVEAAAEALADQRSAQLFWGTAQTSGISFVRHYYDVNGNSVTIHHGDRKAQLVGHATEVDREMRVLRITREGCKDLILANWQCHPRMTGGTTEYALSADIIGAMRMELEADLDCRFAFYQGGEGNVDPTSWVDDEEAFEAQDYRLWGKSMAHTAKAALEQLTPVKTGPIRVLSSRYTCHSNKVDLDKSATAQKVVDYYRAGHTTAEAKRFAEALGLYSYYHASNILSRSGTPDTYPMTVSAVVMGELGWALAPGEFYDSTMKYIRDNSPLPYQFTVGWNSGSYSYYPSLKGWEYGSYETDTSRSAPGTAEGIADRLVDMLKSLA